MGDEALPGSIEPRAWEAVLQHIERKLLGGELAPGDRLPGERRYLWLALEERAGRTSGVHASVVIFPAAPPENSPAADPPKRTTASVATYDPDEQP